VSNDAQPTPKSSRDHPTHPTQPSFAQDGGGKPAARVGKFVLQAKLGEGAMGEVWKAWDTGLNRSVALKLPKSVGEDELARFRREAETAASLTHANIAAIYEVGAEGGRPYIAMQFVEGRTLRAFRRGDRRESVRWMRDASRAVHYAHAKGIIHRDLKPDNVMVDTAGRVFVMDFGLARSVAPVTGLTLSGMMVGTPSYMSPEQAMARAVDARSDVYGLGATLFDLVTGRPPFEGPSVYETVMSVVEDPAPAMSSLDATIDADLDAIVSKSLEKEAERRYGNAEALAADLDRWLRGDPVEARPISVARKIAWRFRRHRVAVALAACGLAVVLVAGGLALRAHLQARRDLEAAEAARRHREAALLTLRSLYTRIVECKDELRQARRPAALAREELAKAVRSLDDYVREWPDEPQGYYVRGRGHVYLDRFDEAEADARRALECRADFRPGWSLLGLVKMHRWLSLGHGSDLTSKRRWGEQSALASGAVEDFERGWPQEGAQDEAAKWGLAWRREDQVLGLLAHGLKVEREEGRHAGHDWFSQVAREYHFEEIELFLTSYTCVHQAEHFEEVVRLAPGWEWAYLARGRHHLGSRRQEQAVADYSRAIELRPDLWLPRLLRSTAFADLGRLEDAIRDCDAAITIAPGEAPIYYNRAIHRSNSGDEKGAIADYDRAIRLVPEYQMAWSNRASLREKQGDHVGARDDYDKALELDPLDVISYCGRGYLRKKTGDEEGALADYSRAIQIRPEKAAEAFDARGTIYTDRGEADRAMPDHDRAVRLTPERAEYWYNRSRAHEQRGDRPAARADLDACLKRSMAIAAAWVSRAQLRLAEGDAEGAAEDCTQGLAIHPKHYNLYIVRAGARLQLHEWENALDDVDEAVRVDPKQPEAYAYRGQIRQFHKDDAAGAIADYEKALSLAPKGWSNRKIVQELLEQAKKGK
jgi:serine/threonine-protein kinase